MAVDLKVVGVVRFSVLCPNYYTDRFPDMAKTAEYLYSEQRMELRFRLFEKLCLYSLMRQSDMDFQLVVLTSRVMPTRYLWRLEDLLATHENVSLLAAEPAPHYRLIQGAYASAGEDGGRHTVRFRLDDDDAVDANFIRRTRNIARTAVPLMGKKNPFAIAYNRGFYMSGLGPEAEIFDAVESSPLSAGLCLAVPPGHTMNPYRYNHRKFPQYFNTLSDINFPAYLRTIHGDNKSDPTLMGSSRRMNDAKVAKGLEKHFGLTPDELRKI